MRKPRLFVYPYKMSSESGKALSDALRATRLSPESPYKPLQGDIVINWGNSTVPAWINGSKLLNDPLRVEFSCDKLKTFNILSTYGVCIPPYTTDKDEAYDWGTDVVVRHLLRSHSRKGIEIVPPTEDLPDAPLYVKYQKKKDEYRLHFVNGGCVLVQKKMRRQGISPDSFQIRNHGTGWIYASDGVVAPMEVYKQGRAAIEAMCLDFGAVDIVYNEHYDRAVVLEVNTAPGLEGRTLHMYATNFVDYFYFGEKK